MDLPSQARYAALEGPTSKRRCDPPPLAATGEVVLLGGALQRERETVAEVRGGGLEEQRRGRRARARSRARRRRRPTAREAIDALIAERKADVVTVDGWRAIARHELVRGRHERRPRVKFSSHDELLAAAAPAEPDPISRSSLS